MKTVKKLTCVMSATTLAAMTMVINGVAIASGSQIDLGLFVETSGEDRPLVMAAAEQEGAAAAGRCQPGRGFRDRNGRSSKGTGR